MQFSRRLISYFLLVLVAVSCGKHSEKAGSLESLHKTTPGYYGSTGRVQSIQHLAQMWGAHVVVMRAESDFCKASLTLPAISPFCTVEGAAASGLATYPLTETLERLSETALVELYETLQRFN